MPSKYHIDLHIHPFLENKSIIDVTDAMDKTGLDVIALESYNEDIYPRVLEEASKFYNVVDDGAGMRLPDGKYILNGREYNTKESIHVITIGCSFDVPQKTEMRKIIDKGLKNHALVLIDHPFVDNVHTRTAGHISEEMEKTLEYLCREYSGGIALEWNAYCIPWIRRGLKAMLNMAGHRTKYHDINAKAEEISLKLSREGYNVPVIADTDLHARSKTLLSAMGTSKLIADIEGECAKDIVSSMKEKIFSGNYENVKEYVSTAHLFNAFCLPILFPDHFWKPRA